MLDLSKKGLQIDDCLNLGQSGLQFVQTTHKWIKIPFYTTQAATNVKITVTGTPDILWTWADGSTNNTADPGAKDMSGTNGSCSLYVSDTLAITKIETNKYRGVCNFSLNIGNLRRCVNLTDLWLYNTVSHGDIISLSGMTGLQYLYLNSTSCTGNISNLSEMVGMKEISLSATTCYGNISSFVNMTGLVGLNLNSISCSGDLFSLSNMTSLISLYIYKTTCYGDISNLENMTNLRALYLCYSEISRTDMSSMISQLYSIRATLGSNNCVMQLYTVNGITETAVSMIEGTGDYLNDGLKDAGCTITY